MLDSDIGNNILPSVRFYQRELPHEFETEKQGRPISYMTDFVRIEIPGDRNTVIDTIASEYHRHAYPIQWARYQNEKLDGGIKDGVSGTLLRDWPILTAAQSTELKHYHFYTVEQIANASDEQLSKIVMVAGMGTHALREKAKSFLARAKDSAVYDAQAQELRKRDSEIQELKDQMASLLAAKEKEEAPRRGRPPAQQKEEVVA